MRWIHRREFGAVAIYMSRMQWNEGGNGTDPVLDIMENSEDLLDPKKENWEKEENRRETGVRHLEN
jgi:hypothetical protein